MRIMLINVTCNQGSTGKITYDLYSEYKKMGHDVCVCYGRGKARDQPELWKFTSAWEVYLHAISTRIIGYVGRGCWFSTSQLIKKINAFKPQVVHLHNIHGYYVHAYRLLSHLKAKKIKVIFTMHDEWLMTGKCGYSYDCTRWLEHCGSCPQKREYPKSWLFDRSSSEARMKREALSGFEDIRIVSVSNWLMERARQCPYLKDKQLSVVYNGVDLNTFSIKDQMIRKKHDIDDGTIILLHITPNFHDPRKGGDFVLQLAKRIEDLPAVIIVVGVDKQEIGGQSNIIFVARTTNQAELADYYTAANLALLTSQKETFSMVCAEALCCGTGVIGFEAGAPSEVAPDGYGCFVPYGDIEALEQLVREYASGTLHLKNSDQCHSFAKLRYGKERMALQYMRLYEDDVQE